MDDKINQCVCIKFCVKLSKSATEAFEMPFEAFGKHSLSQIAVSEWPVKCQLRMISIQGNQAPGK
jgi:hypothetical protein